MRLLIINPNISESVTQLIAAEARLSAGPQTEISMQTAPFGVAYIETRFEALIGAYAVAQVAAEHVAGHDAVIVAAFGDPGLAALREVLPVPVLGMTESALATACLLGHRFSIIAISQRIQAWYREEVQRHSCRAAWPAYARSMSSWPISARCSRTTRPPCSVCASRRSVTTAPK